MARFREIIRNAGKSIESDPIKALAVPSFALSTIGTTVGVANFRANSKRSEDAERQHKEQLRALKEQNELNKQNLEAMKNLTSSLGSVRSSFDSYNERVRNQDNTNTQIAYQKSNNEEKSKERKPSWFGSFFRSKSYSDFNPNQNQQKSQPRGEEDTIDSTFHGASLGFGLGSIATATSFAAKRWGEARNGYILRNPLKTIGYATLIGASLGLLIGITRKITDV